VFLVHGEASRRDALKDALVMRDPQSRIETPQRLDEVEL
jgi:hypothetical protein